MCIINDEADVADTQIFVAPNTNRTRQITVYANSVQTQRINNMMILPVPYPETIDFIDLSKYSDMFKDLEESFKVRSRGMLSYSNDGVRPKSAGFLPVVNVGSYYATLVPDCFQLQRLNSDTFGVISPTVNSILNRYYPTLGFVVCKLRPSSAFVKYHPFAYSHTIQDSGKLFIPTRHHHHGHQEEMMSKWDHSIYSFNTQRNCGNRELSEKVIHLHLDKIPFDMGNIIEFNKLSISGFRTNEDVQFEIAS